jgi:hypothetical protein
VWAKALPERVYVYFIDFKMFTGSGLPLSGETVPDFDEMVELFRPLRRSASTAFVCGGDLTAPSTWRSNGKRL